jgi:uncharacterized protein (DUF3084 family)
MFNLNNSKDEEIKNMATRISTLEQQKEILTKKHDQEIQSLTAEIEKRKQQYDEVNNENARTQEECAQLSEQYDNMRNELKMTQQQVATLREQNAYIRRNLLTNAPFAVLMAERKEFPSSVEWNIVYLENSVVKSVAVLRSAEEEKRVFIDQLNRCSEGEKIAQLNQPMMHEAFIWETV